MSGVDVSEADRRVEWFRDLIDGHGAAAGMDADVRAALRSVTEGTAREIAERLRLREEADRAAAERAEVERRAAEAAERERKEAAVRAERVRLRLQAKADRVAAERAEVERRAAEVAEREKQEAAAEAERLRLQAAARAYRTHMETLKREADAARAAAAREAERKRVVEERERRIQMIGRIFFTVYVVGAFVLFLLLWQVELAGGSIFLIVYLYPAPFGIAGGLLGKKLLDPHERHADWPFVVLGVLMWIVAAAVSGSYIPQVQP